jgi:secreted trypsin-like serine protease
MMRVRLDSFVRARPGCILLGRARALCAAGLALCFAACGQLPNDAAATQSASGVSLTQSAIVGGTADNTDTAVMAIVHQISSMTETACSGTTIAMVGASGILLTAAHCVVGNDGMDHVTLPVQVAEASSVLVLPGPDWETNSQQSQTFGVVQVAVHPCYDGSVNSPYDVALVRYVGALPSTAVIPAITPAEDKLAVGTALTVVGFGKTTTNDMNSQRFEVARSIDSITSGQFVYTQTDNKGACEGDSGGPTIVQTSDGARVAGITSFGDPNCNQEGTSVRVSSVSSFITGFIASAPQTLSCDECSLASTGPGNACIDQSVVCGESNTPCGTFLICAGKCTTQACINQCVNANAAGVSQYNDVVDCQCGGACTSACSQYTGCGGTQTDPGVPMSTYHPTCASLTGMSGAAGASGTAGATGTAGASGGAAGAGSASGCGLTDPRAACESCIENSCCTQAETCEADATCAACLKSVTSDCGESFGYYQLTSCLSSCAGAPCAGSSPTATGSAGAAGSAGVTGSAGATGSAGGGGSAGGKSGCGCDVSPPPGRSSGLALLMALGLVVSRSRARRR